MGPDEKEIDYGIIGEDGAFYALERIGQYDAIEFDYANDLTFNKQDSEITFSLSPKDGLSKGELYLFLVYGFDIEKLKQNNWRRLHGLPMKRRMRR